MRNTAMKRKALSIPVRFLLKAGLLDSNKRVLDYGSGHGFDADTLGMDKYDPLHCPVEPTGKYDTITCNYVLNVVEDEQERVKILERIQDLLAPNGVAYITVRRDKAQFSKFQYWVELGLPSVKKNGTFEIYELRRFS